MKSNSNNLTLDKKKIFLEVLKEYSLWGVKKRQDLRDDNLKIILKHYKVGDKFSNSDIQSLLDICHMTSFRYLNKLTKDGVLKKIGTGKLTKYKII